MNGPAVSRKMTGAQAIVESVKIEGVTKVFCVPGESYLPVMDAIYQELTIDLISARHEGGAAFMAEGYAKATGKPAVVMATRGVGAANLSIGVHTAFQDSTPMVVLLGQVHSQFRGREGFQEVDLDQFFRPIAKWTVEIKDAERVPELMQRAFRIAQSGRPGPVVVALPEDILPMKKMMTFGPPVSKPKPRPAYSEINEIEELLNEASFPLIIAGGGIKSSKAEASLIHFAEKFELPVVVAFRRHDSFPTNHRLYAGHLGLGVNSGILQTVKEADVIVAIGTRLSEVTTQDYSIISQEKKLIHIDISEETIGKVYAPHIGVVADAEECLIALSQIKLKQKWHLWAKARRNAYEQSLVKTNETLNKQIITTLQKHLPADAIITNDAGNFAGWLHTFFEFNSPNTYIGPTSGAMGYGMPAAIGAKLAFPNKTVVSLSGDGGFMMTMQELETAVRYKIPIISIIFNNRMYGTIRMHQEMVYPGRVIGTDLGNVHFAEYAKCVGANGYLVHNKSEFEKALLEALHINNPTVIEIHSDPEQISVHSTIKQLRDS